jgi:prepilin-type N-terminal cleavage/methylation domain-containing protein
MMPARTRPTAESGFTLIEILVTLTILTIGVLALSRMMPAGSVTMSQARKTTAAMQAAAQKIEDLKAADWFSSTLAAGTYTDNVRPFTRTWTITDDSPMTGLKTITVTATWEVQGATRSSVVTTYLGRVEN